MKLRLFFSTVIAAAFLAGTPLAFAQQQAQSKLEEATSPEGYEALFRDLAEVMRKYPGAGKRFSIVDEEPGKPSPASVHRMCCKWGCPHPVPTNPGCGCIRQCDK